MDIQLNNARQAVSDRTEDGVTIPSQPFEAKAAHDALSR